MDDRDKVHLPLAWPARQHHERPRVGLLIVIASAALLAWALASLPW